VDWKERRKKKRREVFKSKVRIQRDPGRTSRAEQTQSSPSINEKEY
jgi:hypothetical protein